MDKEDALLKQKAMLETTRVCEDREELIEGLKIMRVKNVFFPHKDTILLAKSVTDFDGKEILEVGTGSGFIAIYLSKKAKHIDVTDINEEAITIARKNASMNNVTNVSFYNLDLFPENKKYDIIVANLPYTDNPVKDIVEMAVWDENHSTLKRFLKNVLLYLKPSGTIYLSWAEFADFKFFEEILSEEGFIFRIIDNLPPYRIYSLKQKN